MVPTLTIFLLGLMIEIWASSSSLKLNHSGREEKVALMKVLLGLLAKVKPPAVGDFLSILHRAIVTDGTPVVLVLVDNPPVWSWVLFRLRIEIVVWAALGDGILVVAGAVGVLATKDDAAHIHVRVRITRLPPVVGLWGPCELGSDLRL